MKHRDCEIWSKPDAPVEVRAIRSLLLGLRWQLHEWESFDKKVIKVDVPAATMTVGGKPVVSVSIEENKLKNMWLDYLGPVEGAARLIRDESANRDRKQEVAPGRGGENQEFRQGKG